MKLNDGLRLAGVDSCDVVVEMNCSLTFDSIGAQRGGDREIRGNRGRSCRETRQGQVAEVYDIYGSGAAGAGDDNGQ